LLKTETDTKLKKPTIWFGLVWLTGFGESARRMLGLAIYLIPWPLWLLVLFRYMEYGIMMKEYSHIVSYIIIMTSIFLGIIPSVIGPT
jgi:hypothetical protein